MNAADHIGHRVTFSRWPNERAALWCDDCCVRISTGSTIPHEKPIPQEWPQVTTGIIEDRPPVGLCVLPEEG